MVADWCNVFIQAGRPSPSTDSSAGIPEEKNKITHSHKNYISL